MFRFWGSRRSGRPFRNASSDAGEDHVLEPVAQLGQPRTFLGHHLTRDLGGLAEPDDQRHRQGPRAHAALVAAAVHHRRDPHARALAPDVERADALGAVDEMRGARQEIDAHRLDVDGDLADGLRGVGVEDDPLLLGELADGRDVLDGADLVVGEHHGDQDRLVRERLADLLDVDDPVGLHGHVRHLEPLPLEALERVDARALLDDGGDDVVALLLVHLGHALEGEVDRLGAARGEDELLRIARADQRGDLGARGVDRALRLPSERMVAAGRVPELLGEVRQHRLDHARVARRRRLRVHEDRKLQPHRPVLYPLRKLASDGGAPAPRRPPARTTCS